MFLAVLFVVGVGFGAAAVGALGPSHQAELVEYLETYLRGLAAGQQEVAPGQLWRQAVASNLRTAALLWASGPVVLGLLLAPAIVFTRGFVIGFAAGFLSYEFGLRGILLSAVGVLPQNLVAVPALLILSSITASFSLYVLRRPGRQRTFGAELAAYTARTLAMMLALVLACAIEAYVAPVLMRLVTGVAAG